MKKITMFFVVFSSLLFANMETDVANLKVGLDGYYIGQVFSDKEIDSIETIPTKTAGTIKFKDKNLFIVLRKRDNRVIILYQLFDKSSRNSLQKVISLLITKYEHPTTLSHGKIIYWSFDKNGKISESKFKDFKDKLSKNGHGKKKNAFLVDVLHSKTPKSLEKDIKLNNILTLKLNSDKDIFSKVKEEINFYIIISANELIKNL